VGFADVKLNNVLFNFMPGTSRVGDIKLGDRETATLLGESIQPAVLGAPMFCAPEVFLGQDVGPTSDVWSLGVVVSFAWPTFVMICKASS
jgi:serine/threonine protein kinase